MGKGKLANILEMVSHRAKQCEICDSGVVVTCIWDTFDLLVFQVILGSFSALAQNGHNSKTVSRRVKRSEIWDSLLAVTCVGCTFDLLVFKVILPITQKRLAVEQNGVKKFGYN